MVDMVRKNYLAAIEGYLYSLAKTTSLMKSVSSNVKCNYEISTMERLSELTDSISDATSSLEQKLSTLVDFDNIMETSEAMRDEILPAMENLRKYVDEAEMLTSERYWPFPSYGKLLFSVY